MNRDDYLEQLVEQGLGYYDMDGCFVLHTQSPLTARSMPAIQITIQQNNYYTTYDHSSHDHHVVNHIYGANTHIDMYDYSD